MSKKTSVWFLGTSAFAVPSLEALAADGRFSIERVITQPDRPAGRKQVLTPSPVKVAAQALGLQIFQPEDINVEEFAVAAAPDFFVLVAFGQILSQKILDLPTIAPVNVHGSLLPRWRGASPIHHAILAGDAETGVTVQKMVKELDAGPILSQQHVMIEPRETFTSLHNKLAPIGADLLIKTLTSPLKPVEQDQSKMTICHTLKRHDGFVDPTTMTAEEIDRRVRALTPWPGVTLEKESLKILESSLEATGESAPLPCANDSVLHLIKVQPAGGKPMNGAAWKRGLKE